MLTEEDILNIEQIFSGLLCGFVVGGSHSYGQEPIDPHDETRDVDLLMIVPDYRTIGKIMGNNLDALKSTLQVVKSDIFTDEELFWLEHEIITGIRFSGLNAKNKKISIKIVSKDKLLSAYSSEEPSYLGIISKKDRRLYVNKNFLGELGSRGVVNQKISKDVAILSDPDIFVLESAPSLGVISDLLLTGKVLLDLDGNVEELKRILVKKIENIAAHYDTRPKNWSDIFCRSETFSESFKADLDQQFTLGPATDSFDTKAMNTNYFVYAPREIISRRLKPFNPPSDFKNKIVAKKYINDFGPFSSNSRCGVASYEDGSESFFKETISPERFRSEVFGLITTSSYYDNLQKPIYLDSGNNLIAYPWNSGTTIAQQRIGLDPTQNTDTLIELELRKAEDHLRAYLTSFADISKERISADDIYLSRIHDLFWARLMGNRLQNYYGDTKVIIDDQEITFDQLLKLRPRINGVDYPSLADSLEKAKEKLNPERFTGEPLVCGLGDAHSANVMTGDDQLRYLYIDYEFAGFHSPYLDIAKQLFNDLSFEIFYADKKQPADFNLSIKIDGEQLVVTHNYQPSTTSKILTKTKIRGIIEPWNDYLEQDGSTVEDWQEIMGGAFLCCGLLTRNLSLLEPKYFWINLINTIEITDFERYYERIIKF